MLALTAAVAFVALRRVRDDVRAVEAMLVDDDGYVRDDYVPMAAWPEPAPELWCDAWWCPQKHGPHSHALYTTVSPN